MAAGGGPGNGVVSNLTQVAVNTSWGTYWPRGPQQAAKPLRASHTKRNGERPWTITTKSEVKCWAQQELHRAQRTGDSQRPSGLTHPHVWS